MDEKLSSIRNAKSTKPEFRGFLDSIRGKQYNELQGTTPAETSVMRGLWLRIADQAYGSPEVPVYAPDGTIRGSQKIAWGPYDAVAKAVNILDDGSVENINRLMGNGHKIRNFYNNMINPWSERGHVTIDTHAVGAAHWKPFSQKDTEVAHNFGGSTPGTPGAGKHGATGLAGTYPIYDEAYKQAAKEVGVSPRELQSITWEGIRSLFSGSKKTPELRKAIAEIWRNHEAGKISADEARQQIIERAGGFKRPVWTTDQQWNASQDKIHEPMQQMVSLGEGNHKISADVQPTAVTPEVMEYRGKPQPRVTSRATLKEMQPVADWFNANVSDQDKLSSTAHEIAHFFLQHYLGIPTDKTAIRLGHVPFQGGISGGALETGPGLNIRYKAAQEGTESMPSFLSDYASQLMAGRAVEEMLGESRARVREHAEDDTRQVKRVLKNQGMHPALMDSFLDAATDRAKEILKDNWNTVSHMTTQAVQHYGGDKMDSATLHKYRNGEVYKPQK